MYLAPNESDTPIGVIISPLELMNITLRIDVDI